MDSHVSRHARKSSRTTLRTRAIGIVAVVAASLTVTLAPTNAVANPSSSGTAPTSTSQQAPAAKSSANAKPRQSVTLPLSDAAWTSSRAPRKVMAPSRRLLVKKSAAESYLKFDASALEGRDLDSAKLRLWMVGGRAHLGGLVVQQTLAKWKSENVTHRNRPKLLKARLNGKPHRVGTGRWVDVRLKRSPRDLPGNQIAFRLKLERRSVGAKVFARKGAKAPRLTVVAAQGPGTPPVPTPVPNPVPNPDPGTGGGTVFGHYFPPYPISIDNTASQDDYYSRHYLTIDGENGKHQSYGGLLRDRPAARAPLSGDWQLTDMRTEVRQAKSAGLDGFVVDVLGLSGRNWDAIEVLMRAADIEGDFEISPMLDTSSVRNNTPEQTAAALATLFAHPSAQLIDSEYVLNSFCAECLSVSWWTSLINRLEGAHGVPIKFIASFVGSSDSMIKEFAPISYGVGSWGTRNAQMALNGRNWAARAHELGLVWMQAVAMQDARPRSGVYAEAGNTDTWRATWARAMSDGADFVQITTWNDYSESTSIAPSAAHGNVFVELTKYYADWFRAGNTPAITGDHLYLTHRVHPWDANPTSGIKNMKPNLGQSSVAPRDTAEALVFLTAPARVTLTSGSNSTTVDLPAGISTVLVALGTGTTSGSIKRGSTTVRAVTSPYKVTNSPVVQDLQYFAAGA